LKIRTKNLKTKNQQNIQRKRKNQTSKNKKSQYSEFLLSSERVLRSEKKFLHEIRWVFSAWNIHNKIYENLIKVFLIKVGKLKNWRNNQERSFRHTKKGKKEKNMRDFFCKKTWHNFNRQSFKDFFLLLACLVLSRNFRDIWR